MIPTIEDSHNNDVMFYLLCIYVVNEVLLFSLNVILNVKICGIIDLAEEFQKHGIEM